MTDEKTHSAGQSDSDDELQRLRKRRQSTIVFLATVGALIAISVSVLAFIDGIERLESTAVLLVIVGTLFWLLVNKAHKADRHRLYRLTLGVSMAAFGGAVAITLADSPSDAKSKPSRPHEPVKVVDIALDGRPKAIAAQGRYVWVVGNDGRRAAGVLSRIDTQHLKSPAETIEGFKAKDPFDIAIGRKAIWVTDGGSLIKLDLHGDQVWRKSIGNSKYDNEVDVGLGHVWFKQTWPGKLVMLNPGSGREIGAIRLGKRSAQEATAIAIGLKSVWVSSSYAEAVFRFDRRGKRVGEITVQDDPQDLASGRHFVFVAHARGSLVTRIDPKLGEGGEEIGGDIALHGDAPGGIAAGAETVWVPFEGSSRIFALSQCGWERLGNTSTGDSPLDVAVLDKKAYVPNFRTGDVSVFRLKKPLRCRQPN